MNKFNRTLITAALPYANGPKHIGHLAGAYLPADVFARFKRMKGEAVLYVCGSDELGTAITLQAIEQGTTPRAIIDTYHPLLMQCFNDLGIAFDMYHRTSEPLHHATAQEFFIDFYNKGLFEERTSEQYYDAEANVFLADRYIYGECPNCHHSKAYGDQCEKCGKALSPDDLINPKSTLSASVPIRKATKHWYLKLDAYEPWLKEWLLGEKKYWKPNAYGQSKSWIDQGLQPRSMTRDGAWGVAVPRLQADDNSHEGKVLYVWFDAPIGYISATKQYFEPQDGYSFTPLKLGLSSDPTSVTSNKLNTDWEVYWKQKDTQLLHFVGKDNIVFHCIIFPIMLHGQGSYIVPDNVPANEFLNLEGDKMSTSRKWSVEMHDFVAAFPNKADILRYTLISILPETKDSEFTWLDFQTKNNSELVAIFGNLVNRVMVLMHKYYNGVIPDVKPCDALNEVIINAKNAIENNIRNYKFRDAQTELMNLARHGNKMLADKEPWKLIKTDETAAKTCLFDGLQLCAALSILCEPFLPFTAKKLRDMLGKNDALWSWDDASNKQLLESGHTLNEAVLLFEKIEDDAVKAQVEKLNNTKQNMEKEIFAETPNETLAKTAEQPTSKPLISYDEFAKMQLLVGTITHAEKVAKADKLLKLSVSLGHETRTVVSGIAAHYTPEQLVGQQVTLLANLAPRMLKGIESQGMILMAEDENNKLIFVQPKSDTTPGSEIK
jgi:methionyl-tRNA synthetase